MSENATASAERTDLSGRRVLGELVLVASGKVASVAALLLSSVLVARTTGPAEFAFYAAAISFVLLLDGVLGSPLDQAVVRFSALHRTDEERMDRFQGAVFRGKLFIGLAVFGLGFSFRVELAELVFGAPRPTLLVIALGAFAALLLMRGTAAHLQIAERFRAYAVLDGVQCLVRVVGVVVLFALGVESSEAYLSVYGVGAALVFLAGLVRIPQRYMVAPRTRHGETFELGSFVGAAALVGVCGTISGRSDVIVLKALRPSAEVGLFAAAGQIALIPTLVAMYAGIVFQPRVIPMAREGRLGVLVRWNFAGAALVGLALGAMALWGFARLVPLLFGAAFAEAVPLLNVLLLGTFADLLFMPVLMNYAIQLHPRKALVGEALILMGYLAALPFVSATGAMGLAWTVTAVRFAKLLFYSVVAVRNSR